MTAAWLLLHALTAIGVVLPVIATAMGVFSLERLAVHLIIAAYSYYQVRQYLCGGNMISAFGQTLSDDKRNTLERRSYAALFTTALLIGVVIDISAIIPSPHP